jgi:hypothetical protein
MLVSIYPTTYSHIPIIFMTRLVIVLVSNLPEGKGRPARKVDSLTAIYELIVYKMCEPRRHTTL